MNRLRHYVSLIREIEQLDRLEALGLDAVA